MSPLQNLRRSLGANIHGKTVRDIRNKWAYGDSAPASDECIFVDPQKVLLKYRSQRTATAPAFSRRDSGLVLGGDWDLSVRQLASGVKEQACISHFRDGVPWEALGVYEYMMEGVNTKGRNDNMTTAVEIRERYKRLDQMVEEIRRTGRMKTRSELDSALRREHGGVFIHVARDGTPLKAGGGTHRLAIAKLLGLKKMPAQLGVIHRDAVANGMMRDLRNPD